MQKNKDASASPQTEEISITCSATRTSKKIRPRSVSSGPPTTGTCAGTSGQSVQKFSGFGELPNKHFHGPAACGNFGVWPHPNCLPFLSRIRDNYSYTESWIIPKPYFSACFHVGSVKKIRDNFSSLLSCFQYFFIGSFPTFGIIL